MNIAIAMITHNRLEYSKRTLDSLLSTVRKPRLIVADNNSTDGTKEWLYGPHKFTVIFNEENLYPGAACNKAWECALEQWPDTKYLMRLDNDMHLEPGWLEAAESYFKAIPELGQLGLDHDALDHPKAALRAIEINGKTINPWPGCVGGPNIIRRKLWDMGVRYQEMRWDDGRRSPMQEDSALSKAIQDKGYMVGHMTDKKAWTFANIDNWKDYPEYYKKTLSDRGYDEKLKEANL